MRLLLVLFSTATCGLGSAADDPKKPNYYPLTKGNKWEYAVTHVNAEKYTRVVEVSDTGVKDGKLIATVKSWRYPGINSIYSYRADDTGVEELSFGEINNDPPIPRLKFPLKKGDKWSLKIRIDVTPVELTWAVGEPTEIIVPAGKYKAIPVVYVENVGKLQVTNTLHYVDGIGLVRREARFLFGGLTEQLKTFTPGK